MNTPEIRFPHLGINIGHLDPVAFSPFGLEINWYGIFICIAVFAGLFIALNEARRSNQETDIYFDFFFIVVIACIIGARIYYVIFSWQEYKDDLLKIFAFREGGLAIYGAIITAVVTAVIYTRVKKYDFWLFMDTGVFGLIMGQAIGRYGNFFNREAFGGFTDSPLAMQYLYDSKVYGSGITDDILANLQHYNGATYIQVHPTFLYESLWNIALFIILQFYKKHKAFTGEVFMLYLFGYGLGRLWIEGLRTDQLMMFNTGVAVSQALSLLLIVCSAGFIVYKRMTLKKVTSKP